LELRNPSRVTITTALDGPTKAVRTIKQGTATTSVNLSRQCATDLLATKETWSRDQTYDSCSAWGVAEKAPNRRYLVVALALMMANVTSTIDACTKIPCNLAINCSVVLSLL
jgi:hypothetical protein